MESKKAFNRLLEVHRQKDYTERTSVPKEAIKYQNVWNLQWKNQLAINRVYQIALLLKRNPDMIDAKPDGMAWWKKPNMKINPKFRKIKKRGVYPSFHKYRYYEFRIYDADFSHNKPIRHSDFFFVGIERSLKPETICHMQEITDSTYYYGVGRILYSTCGELEASMATFAIVIAYDNGEISLLEARERYNTYIKTILGEFFKSEKVNNIWDQPMPFRDATENYIMVNSDYYIDNK